MKKLLFAILIIQSLAGCANWFTPVGSDTYDCNRRDDPASPHCRSMRSVDDSTMGSIPPTRYDRKFSMTEVDELNGISQEKNLGTAKAKELGQGQGQGQSQTQAALSTDSKNTTLRDAGSAVIPGMPVRQGPIVQRVWIQKFKTDNDTLVQDTYVYKEVQATRWSGFNDGAPNAQEPKTAAVYPHKPIKEELSSPISSAVPTPSGGSTFGENVSSVSTEDSLTAGAVNVSPSKPN